MNSNTTRRWLRGSELATGALKGDVASNDLKVYVYATPPTPKDIPDGYRSPPEVPVGVGEVNGTSFRVIADPSVDLTKFLNESNRVEFRAVGTSSDRYGMWVFDRELDSRGQVVEPKATSEPTFIASESGKLSEMSNSETINLNVSTPASKNSSVAADVAGISGGSDCVYNYFTKYTMVGATFHRRDGMPLKLTYRVGSQTDIDVGVYQQGKGWSIGGSISRMNNSSYGTQWQTSRNQDKFHYTSHRVKHTQCNFQCTSGPSCWYHYQQYKAVTHLGGNDSWNAKWHPKLQRHNCARFRPAGAGYEYVVNNSTATKFRGGISLGPINLGAQTGYDRATSVLGDAKKIRWVCGWTGPATRPGVATVGYKWPG